MFFSLALLLYFLLSLNKALILLYFLSSFLLVGNGYFIVGDVTFTLLILLYMTIDSSFRLKEMEGRIYIPINMFFIFILLWRNPDGWVQWLIISLFVSFLCLKLITRSNERKEQKEIYEELLGEYRKLKRMNLDAERDVRIRERTRIARDIHDSVGHRLTALLMKLEMLGIQHPHSQYDDLKMMARESLEEIRKSVKALQTEENEGIATVIHLIRKLEAESHLSVQFTIKQGVLSMPISNEKSVVLYRIIQEGLTNAMRHAGSREVQVILGKSAIGDLSFEISNKVFTPKPFTFGFGLNNMRARAEEVGGSVEIYQTDENFFVIGSIPSRE